jgi:hypothetical protein
MRIKSFSEARGIFESEEFSLEPHIYCFGGGGGGGDDGGSNDRDEPGDFMGGADEARASAPSGGGFGGGGGRDSDGGSDRDDRNPGNIGVGSGASLGATSNQNFSSGAGRTTGGGDGDDRMSRAAGAYVDQAISDFQNPVGVGTVRSTPAQAASAAFNDTNFASRDAVLGEPTTDGGPAITSPVNPIDVNIFETPEYTSLQDTVSQLQSQLDTKVNEYNTLQSQFDEIAPLADEIDFFKTQANSLTDQLGQKEQEITSLSTDLNNALTDFQGLQTQFDTQTEQLGGLETQLTGAQETIAEQQARIAAQNEAAEQARVRQIAGVPTFDATRTFQDTGAIVDNIAANQERLGITAPGPEGAPLGGQGIGGVSEALDIFDGTADITITGGTPDFNFTRDVLGVDQSIPQMSLAPEDPISRFERQARMGEVAGPMSMAQVDQTRFSGEDMMRQADDVLAARAVDEAVFGDTSDLPPGTIRAGAEIVNALESTFGGNQARKIADVANRPGGALVRDPRSGEVLGAVGPEENISSIFGGADEAVYVGDPRGYEQGVEVGTAILGPNTTVRDVGTQDPFTGQMEGRPGADYSSPVITESRDGDGGQRLLPPPVPPVPPDVPQDYEGRDVVGARGYTPMGPLNISYTGLPSLAPRILQPTRSNMDFLNRLRSR